MFPLYPHDISIETLGLILYQVASVPHHHNPVAAATLDLIDAKLNHVRSTVPAVRAVVGCLPAVGGCRVQKKKKQKKTWNSWVTPSKNCVLWELLSALFFGWGSGIGVVFGIRICYLPDDTTKSPWELPTFHLETTTAKPPQMAADRVEDALFHALQPRQENHSVDLCL